MTTGNPSNYWKDDPIFGSIDLDDEYITNQWLVDQFVGNNLFTWGLNSFGQLGNGTIVKYSSPIQVGSLTNWKQIGCGYRFSAGTKTDGTLWTWGYNSKGQLGNGTIVSYSSPIQIGALTNWKNLSCGYYQTSAIKTDGSLWIWGGGTSGTLGNGTQISYSSPIQVGALTNWVGVSTGTLNTLALKSDGSLWIWGGGTSGTLGNGTQISYSSPIQVGALTNWKQAVIVPVGSVGAIKTDGTLWTWGNNTYGQLGNGTIVSYSSPIQVGSLTNWKQIACGYYSMSAIKTDGTLWTWGSNINGSLGNGTTVYYSSPIQVGSLTNWKNITGYGFLTGGYFSSIKTDGTLWTWGSNINGSLGNGNTVNYSSPIQIGSLTNWKQVACGYYQSTAITFADIT